MNIQDAKIVSDTRLFNALGISVKRGRRTVDALEDQGAVCPLRTPTGRTVLSVREVEAVMKAFTQAA